MTNHARPDIELLRALCPHVIDCSPYHSEATIFDAWYARLGPPIYCNATDPKIFDWGHAWVVNREALWDMYDGKIYFVNEVDAVMARLSECYNV